MCRWLAYQGSPIYLENLLFLPEHSLVAQSQQARQSLYQTNGDGFGLGWYTERPRPGVYREILPAWNDENLKSLSRHVRSSLFMAHVRATSGTAIQRTNCHPFSYGPWLFQHNGEIGGYLQLKEALDLSVSSPYYPHMEGSTDTERLFHIALSFGLETDPINALRRMTERVEALREEYKIADPLEMTLAVSDGRRLFALRYASDGDAPSLFHNKNTTHALRDIFGNPETIPEDAIIILSEPLDDLSEHWEEIPASSILTVEAGKIITETL